MPEGKLVQVVPRRKGDHLCGMGTRTGHRAAAAHRLVRGVAAAVLAALAADAAIAADERTRIRTDEEIRRLIASVSGGLERITEERAERLAERIELDLERAAVRADALPLAAGHELSIARQNLNSLKTRDPSNPAIPLLERRLSRLDRPGR